MTKRRRRKRKGFRISRRAKKNFGRALGWALFALLIYLILSLTVKKPPRFFSPKILGAGPKIVFVIDDIGYTATDQNELEDLGNQVTYAILPMLRYSEHFSRLRQRTGAEVILHLPLEAVSGTIPGPGLITGRMEASHVLDVLNRDLLSVPGHAGVNNHMGSESTRNPALMKIILSDLKNRNLFYLDSRTAQTPVPQQIGSEIGLPVLTRDVFLDNDESQPGIREKIHELAQIARRKGYAIGIGHYRFNTLRVLKEEIPRLKKEGFAVVSLSDLAALKR